MVAIAHKAWQKFSALLTKILIGKTETEAHHFQPAIVRLQEQAPPPLPRAVLRTFLILMGLLALWVTFGQLDIVAVAHGKLVPQSYVQIVQPAEQGIVREILVREGQRVKAGEPLIRMDAAISEADRKSLMEDFYTSRLALRRIDAELNGTPFVRETGDPDAVFERMHAQYQANRRSYEGSIRQARSELASADEMRKKLEALLPTYQTEEQAYKDLEAKGLSGKLATAEKTRQRVEVEQNLFGQVHAVETSRATLQQITSDYRRTLQTERVDISSKFAKLEQELAKQDVRQGLLELKAPQDGIIKDLSTHTVGAVVGPGSVLMTLVPVNETLRAEVWVGNDDIGFVHQGLPAKIKLAAFQFQKYGMLDGVVANVSADATDPNEQQGTVARSGAGVSTLVYKTLVDLGTPDLEVDEERYALSPGMQVSAEIKLGRRTVLEYFLSPVSKAFHEAGRER